ncbi:hypothetical protein [Phenylobacterium sp.]|uniref:hypothetical protein n=1 Tax=Phenylobacterium sp. TaxID=1871053 RepID=UPI00286D5020|nr:hypothetical protein [Phenylobacterium sp.]
MSHSPGGHKTKAVVAGLIAVGLLSCLTGCEAQNNGLSKQAAGKLLKDHLAKFCPTANVAKSTFSDRKVIEEGPKFISGLSGPADLKLTRIISGQSDKVLEFRGVKLPQIEDIYRYSNDDRERQALFKVFSQGMFDYVSMTAIVDACVSIPKEVEILDINLDENNKKRATVIYNIRWIPTAIERAATAGKLAPFPAQAPVTPEQPGLRHTAGLRKLDATGWEVDPDYQGNS